MLNYFKPVLCAHVCEQVRRGVSCCMLYVRTVDHVHTRLYCITDTWTKLGNVKYKLLTLDSCSACIVQCTIDLTMTTGLLDKVCNSWIANTVVKGCVNWSVFELFHAWICFFFNVEICNSTACDILMCPHCRHCLYMRILFCCYLLGTEFEWSIILCGVCHNGLPATLHVFCVVRVIMDHLQHCTCFVWCVS